MGILKPTRLEFRQLVVANWPRVTCVEYARGLMVRVDSSLVRDQVVALARGEGLEVAGIDCFGPESYEIRVFGFPRHLRIVR